MQQNTCRNTDIESSPLTRTMKKYWVKTCYPAIEEIPEQVDVVDVFQRSEFVLPIAESAVKIGAHVFWMQLGIYNEEAVAIAHEAGMDVVVNRCMKIEHARLFGGLNFYRGGHQNNFIRASTVEQLIKNYA